MTEALDPDREVYPNAPLKLVACEVTYTLAPGTDVNAARDAMYESLSEDYPMPGPTPAQVTVEMSLQGAVTHQSSQGFRFLDRERSRSIVATPLSLILESSRYDRFEGFAERALDALAALGANVRIAAVTRIGLRYIDEIQLADLPEGRFDPYFSDSVLAPARPVPDVGEPVEFTTSSRFRIADDRNVVMRTGVLHSPVVSPEGPLLIDKPSVGPFFLIDIDSAWQAIGSPPMAFDPEAIVDMLYALHAPVRAVFEHSITDKLRDDVLRKKAVTA